MGLNSSIGSAQSVITIVLFLIAVINFWTAYKNNSKKDVEKETERNAKINWKLDQLCKSIDDVKVDGNSMYKLLADLTNRLVELEKVNLVNTHDIDDLKSRMTKLEEKGD